jgi:hypothetical protein
MEGVQEEAMVNCIKVKMLRISVDTGEKKGKFLKPDRNLAQSLQ